MKLRKVAKRWLFGSCPGLAGSFRYFGTRVFFPRHSLIFQRACCEGIFEARLLRLIFSLSPPHTTYLDIGANIGLMSVPVLATLPDVSVLSIEPSPANLPWLEKTLQSSAFRARWGLVRKAASDHCGHEEFFSCSPSGGALDGLKDTGRGKEPVKVVVETTTVDQVWNEQGKPTVSCIKIDVEGAELSVLQGAWQCLTTHRPAIVLEWNAVNLSAYGCPPEALLGFARNNGYDVFGITPFCAITSPALLRLAMGTGENFLLLPK